MVDMLLCRIWNKSVEYWAGLVKDELKKSFDFTAVQDFDQIHARKYTIT